MPASAGKECWGLDQRSWSEIWILQSRWTQSCPVSPAPPLKMHDDGKSALHPSCARLAALACVVGRRFSGTKQLPGAVTMAKTPSPLALVGMWVLETAFEIPHGVASPAFQVSSRGGSANDVCVKNRWSHLTLYLRKSTAWSLHRDAGGCLTRVSCGFREAAGVWHKCCCVNPGCDCQHPECCGNTPNPIIWTPAPS